MTSKTKSSSHSSVQRFNYLYHHAEIAICGNSGSGKTALLTKLINRLSPKYYIGYVKYDVREFDIDLEGKDTARAWVSGAAQVTIFDESHTATIREGKPGINETKTSMQECDFVFIEGYENGQSPKVVFLDSAGTILQAVKEGEISNVIAFVGPEEMVAALPISAPYFQRDNLGDIQNFLIRYLENTLKKAPLYGLVLTGGKSTRMNSDKALLEYRGAAQAEVAFNLLTGVCDRAYMSSREGQWIGESIDRFPQIYDDFIGFGPMGGILSAMKAHPHAAWLIVACDLPFISEQALEHLIRARKIFKFATCFKSESCDFPEPLCSIYEPRMYLRLMQFLGMGYECPRKVLLNSPIHMMDPVYKGVMDNVNHPEEYSKAVKKISEEVRV